MFGELLKPLWQALEPILGGVREVLKGLTEVALKIFKTINTTKKLDLIGNQKKKYYRGMCGCRVDLHQQQQFKLFNKGGAAVMNVNTIPYI